MLEAGNFIDGFSPIRYSSGESGNSGEPISGAWRITGAKEDLIRIVGSFAHWNDRRRRNYPHLASVCDHRSTLTNDRATES
jgi:hypothetical protein